MTNNQYLSVSYSYPLRQTFTDIVDRIYYIAASNAYEIHTRHENPGSGHHPTHRFLLCRPNESLWHKSSGWG
ncbi:hypothetical protein [Coleofasciculus chthonoplastes]|uniref:hypothetical protein n=1 Tax=Coleofasciculus chthonoplastes TaxID=64178 RepID=UPI0032F0F10B